MNKILNKFLEKGLFSLMPPVFLPKLVSRPAPRLGRHSPRQAVAADRVFQEIQTAQSCCVVKRDPLRRTVLLGSCRRASLGVNVSPTLRRKAANLKRLGRPRGLLSFCRRLAVCAFGSYRPLSPSLHQPFISCSAAVWSQRHRLPSPAGFGLSRYVYRLTNIPTSFQT